MSQEEGRNCKKKICRRCKYEGKVNQDELCRSCSYVLTKQQGGDSEDKQLMKGNNRKDSKEHNCGICKNEVRDNHNALNCDSCDKWFHSQCMAVSKEKYLMIQEIEEDVSWYCRTCRGHVNDMKIELKRVKEENQTLKFLNAEMQQRLLDLEKKVDRIGVGSNNKNVDRSLFEEIIERMLNLEKKVETLGKGGNIGENIISEVSVRVLETLSEREDKQRRINNLVIYQVDESDREQGQDRELDDKQKCKEIFETGVGVPGVEVEKLIRLGKKPSRIEDGNRTPNPRPLLVILKSTTEKFEILKKARNLKDARSEILRKVVIAPDMTKKERERNRELRQQLKDKRDNGETGWYIKRGQLVKGNF